MAAHRVTETQAITAMMETSAVVAAHAVKLYTGTNLLAMDNVGPTIKALMQLDGVAGPPFRASPHSVAAERSERGIPTPIADMLYGASSR
jgi:hypothetical protein